MFAHDVDVTPPNIKLSGRGPGFRQLGELAIGPNGDVYASSAPNSWVLRFDGATGNYLGIVASATTALDGPRGLAFGSDGSLYVSSARQGAILRYTPDGQFLGRLTNFGLVKNPTGLSFGPDGNLYVADVGTGSINRLNPTTGELLGVFVQTPLVSPQAILFGADGDLYVADQGKYSILRFDGTTGQYKSTFVSGSYPYNPIAMTFADGYLFTTNLTGGATGDGLAVFDETTGDSLGLVFNGDGNYWSAGLVVVPEPSAVMIVSAGVFALSLRRRLRGAHGA